MEFGVDTYADHLDDNSLRWDAVPPAAAKPGDPGSAPVFAGRTFLADTFSWAHGEGSTLPQNVPYRNAAVPPSLTLIAPIQAPSPRQSVLNDPSAEHDISGWLLGHNDGREITRRVTVALKMGEFVTTPPPNVINIFLAVDAKSEFSSDYWDGWSAGIWWANSGYAFPFRPGILCQYLPDAMGVYQIDPNVSAVLDHAIDRKPVGPPCCGLWAEALAPGGQYDVPGTLEADPFANVAPYSQPTTAGSELVPLLVRRYALGTASPVANAPCLDVADPVPLGGTAPQALEGMLTLNPYFAIDPTSPTATGIDASRPVTKSVKLKGSGTTTTFVAAIAGSPVSNAPMNSDNFKPLLGGATLVVYPPPPPAQNAQFVFRYYDSFDPGCPHHVSPAEIDAIHNAGLRVGVYWETARGGVWFNDQGYRAYLRGGFGTQDAYRKGSVADDGAFSMAFHNHQPPWTPIYFALDANVGVDDADIKALVLQYFADLKTGYGNYLAAAGPGAVPYSLGVYGDPAILQLAYEAGFTYFCQCESPGFTRYDGGPAMNSVWPHCNMWQYTGDYTDPNHPEFHHFPPENYYWLTQLGLNTDNGDTGIDYLASWGDEGSWAAE